MAWVACLGKARPVIADTIRHGEVVIVPEVAAVTYIVKDKGEVSRMVGPSAARSARQV